MMRKESVYNDANGANGEMMKIMIDMKKFMMIIMAVALMALPTMAQQPDWKSTSTMQGTGSAYAPQVMEVGATTVPTIATTTESYSPNKAPSGPRRGKIDGADDKPSNQSPIGDAVLPLMLMAMLFAGVVYTRRKKQAAKS